jgi:acetyl esterase/lipase
MVRILLILVALFGFSACQSTGLYFANLPNDTAAFEVRNNVKYGKKPWQKLDIYMPKPQHEKSPVMIFYYGGSWVKGSKEEYTFVANRFVQHGYIVVIPDYVKYPEAVYPAFVEDAAKVTHWLDQNIETIGGDREQIHLIGHSAGAHIGAMLIANEYFLAKYGLKPSFYRSFIGISGPYSFTPETDRYRAIFGPKEKDPMMQANRYINGNEPPMLLLHGNLDFLVNTSNMEKLATAVKNKGGVVKTVSYSGLGHLSIIAGFSNSFPFGNAVARDMIAFMEEPKQPNSKTHSMR